MANLFDRFRFNLMGVDAEDAAQKNIGYSDNTDNYETLINQVRNNDQVSKGLRGKETAYSQPMVSGISINPDYMQRPTSSNVKTDLHRLLKRYSGNTVLNAIINTRANQVSLFAQPDRFSEKGMGFQLRMKDLDKEPTAAEKREMAKIEDFILNTGNKPIDHNNPRDSFVTFLKKVVRDTYIYDQVNFEKIFDKDGNFLRYNIVDPTTIYFGTDENGRIPTEGKKYVQVMDGRVVAEFEPREMAFAVRNPRSDIYAAGYGYSELEVGLKTIVSHENTERFNDRFFSHGGTTRGVLLIKTEQNQSHQALDMFKREWKNSLSGINGSWQIPVITAEDAKYVNMTQSARDMEFRSWLDYLINLLSALYGIDPSEINFPNRGGGASGGSGGPSLNEGNSSEKTQASQNKGLLPLLKFLEDIVNTNIVSEFSNKYHFQFTGGDITAEMNKLRVLSEKASFAMTINEAREELGLPGDIIGGDTPANGVIIQRIGQVIQEENFEYQKQQDRLNQLLTHTGTGENSATNIGLSFQDIQQGLAGNADNVDGRDTTGEVGKDGQSKEQVNANRGA